MNSNTTVKSIFLLSILFLIISCSSDDDNMQDDNKNPGQELSDYSKKLLGSWKLIDRENTGIEVCERSTTFNFNSDKTLEFEQYFGDNPDNCSSNLHPGSWKNPKPQMIVVDFDEKQESDTLNITFKNSGSKFKLIPSENTLEETYKKQ